MKKTGLLNHRISEVIACMGHTDTLVIADAGLPIPPGVERIDLAVRPGLPEMIEVVTAIAGELQVETVTVATELEERNPAMAEEIRSLFPGAAATSLSHEAFKEATKHARAVIRTGECSPYANVILTSGVIF